MKEVEGWLTDWFATRAKIAAREGNDAARLLQSFVRETDYFEAGWLTSMEVVEFVTEIERRFGMQFSDRDLQDPRFVTIAGLAELILERSAQASESG